jgi:glycine amidinotransferase/scyllo-inosamine-4-phosphate amidinotransferase 1
MIVESWNEWDPLETVIVGSATGARVPRDDISLRAINYADDPKQNIQVGPYPRQVVDEANEDLEQLCSALKSFGVEVLRPDTYDTSYVISNGLWETEGYYSFCPRDSVLVHGDAIIETPMPLRSRYGEQRMFEDIFRKAEQANWIKAPKPSLTDDCYDIENVSKDRLTLLEREPCFDAANVLRCGYDLFYLVSNSGNKKGAEWLRNTLGYPFKVHTLEGIYSYMHLDSTISFLRPGLVLLNPARMNESNLPDVLKSWDKIWCAEPVDIGFYGNYKNASVWIGMNLVMVNPRLAIVEKSQTPLIKQLESHGVEVCALPMRHSRTLGGAFHCVTLDLRRKGTLEKYF